MWHIVFTVGMLLLFVLSLLLIFKYPQEKRRKGWYGLNGIIMILMTILLVINLLIEGVTILGMVFVGIGIWGSFDSLRRASRFS